MGLKHLLLPFFHLLRTDCLAAVSSDLLTMRKLISPPSIQMSCLLQDRQCRRVEICSQPGMSPWPKIFMSDKFDCFSSHSQLPSPNINSEQMVFISTWATQRLGANFESPFNLDVRHIKFNLFVLFNAFYFYYNTVISIHLHIGLMLRLRESQAASGVEVAVCE